MEPLSVFEIELLRALQEGLPLYERPFAAIARTLDTTEDRVIQSILRLKAAGVIRRVRAHLNYRALGFLASLVTAHVPDEKFRDVAAAVSAMQGVSHSYCRDHYYNLWFTLQARSLIAIEVALDGLREEFDLAFYSLPAVRWFKLDVRFDPAGPGTPVMSSSPSHDIVIPDVPPPAVELSEKEKAVLSVIQDEIRICECPFEFSDVPGALSVLQTLRKKGVVSRIAAVLDYHKLGYAANALVCLKVPSEDVVKVGKDLASASLVSHCYERRTFNGWWFNLYAMFHAGAMESTKQFIRSFCAARGLTDLQVLPTLSELKKQPVKLIL